MNKLLIALTLIAAFFTNQTLAEEINYPDGRIYIGEGN